MTIINGESNDSVATINGGYSVYGISGDAISGDHINIINRGYIDGGFGYTQSGDAISGSYINIDNSGWITGGGTASNDFGTPGLTGRAITGDHLTITNSGFIRGSYVNGKRSAALNFTGGANSLTMNNGTWSTSVRGDIILDSVAAGSTEGNSLFITSNITDASRSTVDGRLNAGSGTSVAFSGNKVTFSGDASFGEYASLTLTGNGGLATKGSMTFGNGAQVKAAVSDWTQDSTDLLSADNGISGLSMYNISNTLLADGARDYVHVSLSANKLTYGLAWNAQDGSAHGDFALRDGASLTLHTALADNTATHATGWDGTSLTKSGNGVLDLAAQNTYTGSTIIDH
ncbi:TPA: hypothetical protein IGZ58_003546 [Escherichia coli]|nr:hypothetical protein [Escherichia coli]